MYVRSAAHRTTKPLVLRGMPVSIPSNRLTRRTTPEAHIMPVMGGWTPIVVGTLLESSLSRLSAPAGLSYDQLCIENDLGGTRRTACHHVFQHADGSLARFGDGE